MHDSGHNNLMIGVVHLQLSPSLSPAPSDPPVTVDTHAAMEKKLKMI